MKPHLIAIPVVIFLHYVAYLLGYNRGWEDRTSLPTFPDYSFIKPYMGDSDLLNGLQERGTQ